MPGVRSVMTATVAAWSVLVALVAAPAAGQSLGQVAAQEAARRKAITAPARVITDEDLRVTRPSPIVAPAPIAAADDPGTPAPNRTPARLRVGAPPQIPVQAVGGGDVAIEASISSDGRVTGIARVRHAAPFTEALSAAVQGWQFAPAVDVAPPPRDRPDAPPVRTPTEASVLVLGLFRPPALFNGTLGTPPVDVGRASEMVPYPTSPPPLPAFPPNAFIDGVVVVELSIDASGAVAGTRLVHSSPAFDQAALDTVSYLRFRPAQVRGRPSPSLVYVVAAFRAPVTL
jgi:TonB family protein